MQGKGNRKSDYCVVMKKVYKKKKTIMEAKCYRVMSNIIAPTIL